MTRRDFDDICHHCGCPLPLEKRPKLCPECSYDFETRTAPVGRAYLTVFGHGVCGLIAGGFVGAAWALTLPMPWQQPMMVLMPVGFGVAGALATAQVGRHLDRSYHQSYELWLLSADIGALIATTAALAGTTGAALLGLGLLATCAARRLLTRLSRSCEMPDSPVLRR